MSAPLHPYHGGLPMPDPPTVCGLPLEPGERVVYFHHTKNIGTRIALFFLGLGLLSILVGVVFLWGAFTNQTDTHVVTNRRFIRMQAKKPPQMMALRAIKRVVARRSRRWISEVDLHDADDRRVEIRVMHDEKFRDLVFRLAKDPDAAEAMPAVVYLA